MLNILIAYPYLKKDIAELLKQNEHRVRFLLDSGAFTAWKTGKQITVDEYCRFIEGLPLKPWRYFNLDVIGDGAASFQNYEIMRARGFTPVPIFTRGESVEVLEEYYKTSDVVGIGGLVGTKGNKGFVKGIMRHVCSRKVHWLGFTNFDFLKHFRPYMVDSSSTWGGQMYGQTKVYDGGGRFLPMKRRDFHSRPSEAVMSAIARMGLNPREFAKEENWRGWHSMSMRVAARSFVGYQRDVDKNLGTKVFCACATKPQVELMIEEWAR